MIWKQRWITCFSTNQHSTIIEQSMNDGIEELATLQNRIKHNLKDVRGKEMLIISSKLIKIIELRIKAMQIVVENISIYEIGDEKKFNDLTERISKVLNESELIAQNIKLIIRGR